MTKIEELEKQLNECQKALAELKESKKGNWKPKDCDRYWFRTDEGEFDWCNWIDDKIDNWRYNNMPIFKTKEECESYWHFMDAVKEKSYEFSKEEWEDSTIKKYHIEYTYSLKKFDVMIAYNCKDFHSIYFKTAKDTQYIIDNFKEELMEYWL